MMYRSHVIGQRFIRHFRRLVVQNGISQKIALLPFRHKILISMLSGSGFVLCCREGLNIIQAAVVEDKDTTIINEANSLYESGADPRHLYDYLKRYKTSKNAKILWRFARAARDLVLSGTVAGEEKKALSYEAFEASKQALEEDDSNYGSHKWYAITLSDLGDYEGTKMKISNAYIIKEHFEKALEINPNDATTAHCMGMWCLAFAELSWYKQKIAALLFGEPPTSTYEEAINMFEMAERIEPGFYSVNLFQLGKCYKAIGNVKRAMLFLDKASNYPAKTTEDEETTQAAKKLLEELIKENKK